MSDVLGDTARHLGMLADVLHGPDRLTAWPSVREQLAPLVDLASTELAPAAASRFHGQLRDVERHPQLWALTLAFALRGELPPADDEAPADSLDTKPPAGTLPATAEALLAAFRTQLAVILAGQRRRARLAGSCLRNPRPAPA